jgi:hypothetical protein
MHDVSDRVRWAAPGGVAVVAVIVVIVVLLIVKEPAGRRSGQTWVVQPGETLMLSPDDVRPDDLHRCQGKGGVNGTPPPGTGVSGSGGLSVMTALDGSVTTLCEPGPPGSV